MRREIVQKLPFGTVIGFPTLQTDLGTAALVVHYAFQGEDEKIQLAFSHVSALKIQSEAFCSVSQVSVGGDLVEFLDSEWAATVANDRGYSDPFRYRLRHFGVFIEDFGLLEVLADSFQLQMTTSSDDSEEKG